MVSSRVGRSVSPPPPPVVGVAGVGGVSESVVDAAVWEQSAGDEREKVERGGDREGLENVPVQSLYKQQSHNESETPNVSEISSAVVENERRKEKLNALSLPKQQNLSIMFAKQLNNTPQPQIMPTISTTAHSTTQSANSDSEHLNKHPNTKLLPLISSTLLPPAPKLSSVEEFVLREEEKTSADLDRELTPLEQFQQKLMEQMSGWRRNHESCVVKEEDGRDKDEEKEGESRIENGEMMSCCSVPKPLIPSDVISKLKDKPGKIYIYTIYTLIICLVYMSVSVCVCVCVCLCVCVCVCVCVCRCYS